MKKAINNSKKNFHDEFQTQVMEMFNLAGFNCENEDINSGPGKKADLKCENEKILIEIKTFQGGDDLKARESDSLKKINYDLDHSLASVGWLVDKPYILKDHLKSASEKFAEKKYESYKTAVFFANELSINDQDLYDLLQGCHGIEVEVGTLIGVLVQVYDWPKKLVVFFNKDASVERQFDSDFFDIFLGQGFEVVKCVIENRKCKLFQ